MLSPISFTHLFLSHTFHRSSFCILHLSLSPINFTLLSKFFSGHIAFVSIPSSSPFTSLFSLPSFLIPHHSHFSSSTHPQHPIFIFLPFFSLYFLPFTSLHPFLPHTSQPSSLCLLHLSPLPINFTFLFVLLSLFNLYLFSFLLFIRFASFSPFLIL